MNLKVGDYVKILSKNRHYRCIGTIIGTKEISLRDTKETKKSYKVLIFDHSYDDSCNGKNTEIYFFEEHIQKTSALNAWRTKSGGTGY